VDTQTSHASGSNAKNNNNVNGLHNGLSSKQKAQEEAEDLKIDGFKGSNMPCEEELSEDDDGEDSEGRSMTTRKRKHHQISGYLQSADFSSKKKPRENGLVDLTKKFIDLLKGA